MSLPRQEAAALMDAYRLLLNLSSGLEKNIPSATRQRARDALRHYPLAAGLRWLEHEEPEEPCVTGGTTGRTGCESTADVSEGSR